MKPITVYTTTACVYCVRVKKLLAARGLDYTEVDLSRDHEGRTQLAELTGLRTFPQVLIGDELLGGYDQTVAADRSGRLSEMLAA